MTIAFAGTFFDGRSSRRHSVRVELDQEEGALVVEGDETGTRRFSLEQIEVAPRVGDTPRFIQLEGGASLEVADNDAVDRLVPDLPGGRFHLIQHVLESNRRWIVTMLALTIGLGWAMIEYGVPYLAKRAAFAMPHEVDAMLGDGALAALDEFLFEPTTLDADVRADLERDFVAMVAKGDLETGRTKLVFRASPVMGANALALPSGIVIMTDELVRMAQDQEEVLAVLAHEIGHIRYRHSLRGVLQNTSVALMIASLTGDLASLTSLSATLPTALVQLKYSRDFEYEADDFAAELLTGMGLDPTALGDILKRMTESFGEEPLEYFSTHPATAERMKRIDEGL